MTSMIGWWKVMLMMLMVVYHVTEAVQLTMQYNVDEEEPVGRMLGDLVWDAGLQAKVPRTSYSLQMINSQHSSLFAIDGHVLKTAQRLDREALCASSVTSQSSSQAACMLQITVAVDPVDYFLKISISVADINDNSPSFLTQSHELQVSEAALPGAMFPMPTANDLDFGANGISTYILHDENEIFTLITNSNQPPSLQLKRALDRETRDRYAVKLVAMDIAGQSDTLNVDVIVLDANDHRPVFTQSTYTVTVPESTPVNDVISIIRASDADGGANGRVTYSVSPTWAQTFSVNNVTGEVRLKTRLDYESRASYELLVLATDGGQSPLVATATVTVVVTDVNDNAPSISITASSLSTSGSGVSAEEGVAPGTRIAYVTASDKDGGVNGGVSCWISSGSKYFTLRAVGEAMYGLVTVSDLDRELNPSHDVIVSCADHGIPPMTADYTLLVLVRDVNDNSPQFSQSRYDVSMPENNDVGQRVLTLTASDPDAGANGSVTYSVDSRARSLFDINSTSGAVYALTSFDREARERIQFSVTATDGGTPPRRTAVNVTLHLTDINDEPPKFTKYLYELSVFENLPAGAEVGRIEATEKDLPPFNSFVFSLANPSTEFRIDAKTGHIFTIRPLDREMLDSYDLTVVAKDTESPYLSSTANVKVIVTDVNDNTPFVTSPRDESATVAGGLVHVHPNEQVGQTIIRIMADDRDVGANSRIQYSLSGASPDGLFAVNPTSGDITVQRSLIGREGQRHRLTIFVTDCGKPPLGTNVTVQVTVNSSAAVLPGRRTSHMALASTLGRHEMIIALLAAGTLIVVVLLVVAIVCTKRSQSRRMRHKYIYRQRQDNTAANTVYTAAADGLRHLLDSKTSNDVVTWQQQQHIIGHDVRDNRTVIHRLKAQTLPAHAASVNVTSGPDASYTTLQETIISSQPSSCTTCQTCQVNRSRSYHSLGNARCLADHHEQSQSLMPLDAAITLASSQQQEDDIESASTVSRDDSGRGNSDIDSEPFVACHLRHTIPPRFISPYHHPPHNLQHPHHQQQLAPCDDPIDGVNDVSRPQRNDVIYASDHVTSPSRDAYCQQQQPFLSLSTFTGGFHGHQGGLLPSGDKPQASTSVARQQSGRYDVTVGDARPPISLSHVSSGDETSETSSVSSARSRDSVRTADTVKAAPSASAIPIARTPKQTTFASITDVKKSTV